MVRQLVPPHPSAPISQMLSALLTCLFEIQSSLDLTQPEKSQFLRFL